MKLVLLPPEILAFFRYSAIIGFVCTAVLLINLNKTLFDTVLRDSAKKFWWLFLVVSLVPLLVIIAVFDFFFGGKIVQ
jgi:hypothetical protein